MPDTIYAEIVETEMALPVSESCTCDGRTDANCGRPGCFGWGSD